MFSIITTFKQTLFISFLIGTANIALAQTAITSPDPTKRGTIKGSIKDATKKEPLTGAMILVSGTKQGAISDENGEFTIEEVASGNQKLEIQFLSYKNQEINVNILPSVITPVEVKLEEEAKTMAQVVVTATRKTNTETAVLAETRRLDQIVVGVSAAQIAKTQDRDASAIIKRVPGVSITDDRFVTIRGLSERYNTVLLNDVLTPSTEIDVRAFAFDLVPAAAIDRMLVFKTGAAELPGEFAGGVIKIYTKTNTDENSVTANLSTGFRSGSTFQQAVKYKGSETDALGFDRTLRTQLSNLPSKTVLGADRNVANSYYSKLPTFFDISTINTAPDLRAGVGYNHNWTFGKQKLSTITALNYSNTNANLLNAIQERYQGIKNDELAAKWTDQTFQNSVRIGAMSNWAYTFNPRNKLTFSNLYNQIATDQTTVRTGINAVDGIEYQKYGFRYEQKSILSSQLAGAHDLSDRQKLTWTAGYGYTNRNEPDYRQFSMSRAPKSEKYTIDIPLSGSPSLNQGGRYFSELGENTFTGAVNFEQKLGAAETKEPIKIRTGIYTEQKVREVNARWFGYINPKASSLTAENPTTFFAPANLNPNTGLSMYEGTNNDDKYSAQNTLAAAYVSANIPITTRFKAVIGLRGEYNRMQLQSKKRGGGTPVNVDNPVFTPLPSLNLSYQINDKQALRLAYSYTVNRPEFREISPLQYYDFALELSKIGNPDLKSATIHNIDARYEIYPNEGEMITFAAFAKQFTNPIEMTGTAAGSGTAFFYSNPKSAVSAGVEVEMRKRVAKDFTLVANASYIYSEVDASNIAGQVGRRALQGQSPYLINAGVFYQHNTWQANILYNIIGERIYSVGDNLGNQTVFEMPRHQVDANFSKMIGRNMEVKLGVGDLLNQATRWTTDTNNNYKADSGDNLFSSFQRGTYTTVGLNAKF